jgi:hypothetical protein
LLLILAGCTGGASGLRTPRIDAAGAAKEAIALYDANKDGALSTTELAKCPGLGSALRRTDANGDGQLSADEIAARIRSWSAHGTILKAVQCRVLFNGRPLAGAEVVLEPERFLTGALTSAKGETNAQGIATVSIPRETLSSPSPSGVFLGLYTVRITSPGNRPAIPPRYNQTSELGQEVADDSFPIDSNVIDFRLSTS